jgi:hypothetical protein
MKNGARKEVAPEYVCVDAFASLVGTDPSL